MDSTTSAERRRTVLGESLVAAEPIQSSPADRVNGLAGSAWPTLGLALLGGLLLWLAFPPLGLWPLAWVAPVPWLWIVARETPLSRRQYAALWLAGMLFWSALLQGIRTAHPALIGGWLVLSAYLALYLPLFVVGTRLLVHCWHWPLALAAPVAWVGIELFRGYFATGFSVALLCLSQTSVPLVLQTADLVGPYGPSFVMMLVASAITLWLLRAPSRERLITTFATFAVVLATLVYGTFRLQHIPSDSPIARVMLVQGCVDTVLDDNPNRPREMLAHYRSLTLAHLPQEPVDLVVWPESAFTHAEYRLTEEGSLPKAFAQQDYEQHAAWYASVLIDFANMVNRDATHPTQLLVGGTSLELDAKRPKVFNAAMLISPQGKVTSRYFKSHLVMFGEYIPLGEWFPIIYSVTPMASGLSRGREFTSFEAAKLRFAPNICFESTAPQLIRRQVNTLAAQGREPDVLLNTTNDGWFYGTSILDLHMHCAVLRAIENRKPFLIAANTGISAVIDGNGNIRERGPTHETAILLTEVQADGRSSIYRTIGDWPAAMCLLVLAIALASPCLAALRRRFTKRAVDKIAADCEHGKSR